MCVVALDPDDATAKVGDADEVERLIVAFEVNYRAESHRDPLTAGSSGLAGVNLLDLVANGVKVVWGDARRLAEKLGLPPIPDTPSSSSSSQDEEMEDDSSIQPVVFRAKCVPGLAALVINKPVLIAGSNEGPPDLTIRLYECGPSGTQVTWVPDLVAAGQPLLKAILTCLEQARLWSPSASEAVSATLKLARVGQLFRTPPACMAEVRGKDLPVLGLVMTGLLYNNNHPIDLVYPGAFVARQLSLLTERLLSSKATGLRSALRYLLGTKDASFRNLEDCNWKSVYDGLVVTGDLVAYETSPAPVADGTARKRAGGQSDSEGGEEKKRKG